MKIFYLGLLVSSVLYPMSEPTFQKAWDAQGPQVYLDFGTLNEDDNQFVFACEKEIIGYNLVNGTKITTIPLPEKCKYINSIDHLNACQYLLTSNEGEGVIGKEVFQYFSIYDLKQGTLVNKIDTTNNFGFIRSTALSADKAKFFYGGSFYYTNNNNDSPSMTTGMINIYDLSESKTLQEIPVFDFGLSALAPDMDGQYIVAGGTNVKPGSTTCTYGLCTVNSETSQIAQTYRDPALFYVTKIIDAGKNIYTSGGKNVQGPVLVWDKTTAQKIDVIGKEDETITTIAQLTDNLLISGDALGLLKIWDMRTRKMVGKEDTNLGTLSIYSPLASFNGKTAVAFSRSEQRNISLGGWNILSHP
jgi:WD40 repeat protein